MDVEYVLIVGVSSLLIVFSTGFLIAVQCRRRLVEVRDWVPNPINV